jgi:hypothetical protein
LKPRRKNAALRKHNSHLINETPLKLAAFYL